MAHNAQRVMLGLAIAGQAILGGLPASAQLSVPPPKIWISAREPIPPLSLISSTAEKDVETASLGEAAPIPAAARIDNMIGLSLAFNDRRAPQGRVLTGTLSVTPPADGTADSAFDVAIDLPPGLDFVTSGDKGVTYDPAQRAVIMAGMDTGRASQRGRTFMVHVGAAPSLSTLTPQVRVLARADGQAFRIRTASLLVPGGGEKTRIDAKGGSVTVAGGAARLDFGPGALRSPQTVEASLTVSPLPSVSAKRADLAASDEEDNSAQQPIWSITLSPDVSFETPVTLTTNISGLVSLDLFAAHEAVLEMRYVYTAWVTRTTDTGEVFSRIEYQTAEMPVSLDEATGEVTARLWHFSTYDLALAQPAAPKPWTPSANAPNVALFRGAATYQQPLPALPSFGLEPKLTASYSSASAESNFLQTSEPGMKYQLGRGWSLELPHIAQLVKRDWILGNPPEEGWRAGFETEARGNFTLVMGGMSVGLKPTGANGEYVTEDSRALRIVRCAKASPCAAGDQLPGITHSGADWDSGELEYWQVWTPDGTRYVFGSETSARVTVQDWDYNWCWNGTSAPGCGSGWNGKLIGMAWMLRRVYAPDRDLLSASVDRWGAEYQYVKTTETGSRCAMANWNTQICGTQDDPRIRPAQIVYGNSLLGASERYTVTFGYSGDKVTEVTAYEPGNRPAERTRLSYVWVPFYGVGDELSALTSEAYTGTSWVGLPATTFAASQVSNLYNGNGYGPDPKRLLSRVENGLGARWNFTYQPDTSGYHASFRVTSRSVVPAGTGPATIESYTYSGGCYNWPDQPCSDPSRSWASGYTNWAMGYGQVTRTVMDEAGVPLAIEAHRFYTDAKRMGREYETRYRDGSGTVLSTKQSDIVTVTLSGYPTTTWQVRTTETREYPFGDVGSALVKRTRTDAFAALGSPKTIQEYGFEGAGDERTTFIGYIKGPVAGEVPVWEALYSGLQTAESETPERLSSTRLYYDGAEAGRANSAWTGYNVYSQTLSRGRLTAVEHGLSALGGQPAAWVMSAYGYDGLGNLAVLTDAGLNVSSVNYDSSGQFVLGSHNALGQVTSYAYYGINGESLTSMLGTAQPYGALKSTTDPNGATVMYAYDALGRLRKVAQPGDSLADPSEEWRYYDGIETAWTATATGFSAGPYLSDHLVRGVSGGGWTSATLATFDRTIYDGLGRAIQTQTRAGQGWAWASCNDSPRKTLGAEVIQSTLYDALGRAAIQTVPYTQTQYEYCTTAGRVNAPYVAVPQTQTVPNGTGLAGAYYNGTNFDTLILEKTDATVNFNWYGGSPYPGIINDNQFSARWTGYVRASTSETYTVYATGDDGIRLWINGQLLVDQWHLQGATEYSATMEFQAGAFYELRFDYFENNDGAEVYLKWASPTISKRIIPTANLYRVRPYVTALAPPTMPSGTGLTGAYFNGKSFETQVLERTDATINFNWYGGSPAQNVVHDNEFSAHWTGYVRADTSETYTIYATVDDGIRLWVNGQLRVDQWHNQGPTEYSTTVTLQAGGFYPIQFDYFENTDGAEAYLKWASPTVSKRIIPAANLYRVQPYIPATLTVPYARTDYDGLGRPITVTAPDGSMSVTRYGVDTNGPDYNGTNLSLKTMIDPNGHQKQQVSDGLGRMVRVREFDGTGPYALLAETRYAYDAGDRLTTVTDTLGNTTTITYDALGRKIGMVDPDMGIWSYSYNALGQLITQTDALSQTMVFTYDALGRMTGKGVAGASPSWLASYLYDQGNNGIGRRARMTDTTGFAAWVYDARGRVIEARKWVNPYPGVYVTTFGYDAANRLISNTLPGGTEVVTTTYDAAGQPFSLFAGGRSLVQSAAYNALGAPTRVSFGNGLDKVNQYFGLDYTAPSWAWSPLMAYGRLRSTCVITASQTCSTDRMDALLNTVFWYDKVGNVTTVRDNVLNSKMLASYDALDRLVTATTVPSLTTMSELAPMTETYAYNAIGNLTGRYGVSATGAITYPTAGNARPHAALATASGNRYAYDANGNMTLRVEMSGTEAFTYTQAWTVDNRLLAITKTDVSEAVLAVTRYAYDGDGVRVRKEDPDGIVLYIGALEQTIGAPGTATVEYFDDITGTATLSGFLAARGEPVAAGLTRFFTSAPPLPSMGGEPYGLRWQLWLTVPVTDTYTFAVYADDGFSFSGNGLAVSNTTAQVAITKESALSLTLSAGVPYNFSLTYLNYSPTTAGVVQLLWRRAGGSLEIVPVEALHARTRREYFSFGGAIVAMKDGVLASGTVRTLTYLHGDHLGSVSLTTNASGQKVSEQRYKPYGEVRWSSGAGIPTDKQFTSQTRLAEGYVGTLYDYVSRAYDPVLGRFISADTIVPGAGNSQGFNRYMYVLGNPLLRIDPSGHDPFISLDVFRARLYAMQSEVHTNPFYGELGVKADTGKLYRDYGSAVGALGLDEFRDDNGFFMAAAAEKVSNVMLYQGCEYCLPTSELEGFGRRVGEADGNNMASYNPGSLLMFASSLRAAEPGGCSFSPDTLVATDAGYVPIAGVITGTRVVAWDEMANATGYYPVTNVWTHWDPILVVLIIDGETITTTPEHPFYTPMHGWLPAGELWVGAGLRTASGGTMVVDSTSLTFHPSQMWNLSVDGAHTYFVGQSTTLVHNTCDDGGVIGRNMMSRLRNELLDPPEVRGKAPRFHSDGSPVEIHHVDQNPAGPFVEMHWDDHRGAGNFAENHPGSQGPINRTQFDQQKKQYWRFEWDRGRWSPEE